jgi:hypothetical protein
MARLHTADIDMADTVNKSDIADFLTNTAWPVCSTYHTVQKISPGAAIFGRDMLFDVPFLADWSKNRGTQTQTNRRKQGKEKQCPCRLGLSTR